jgi:hypothetical protein
MYRQLYPLPIFCYFSAINSKMSPRKVTVAKKAKTPPKSPTRASAAKAALSKRNSPTKGGKGSPKKKLKTAPVAQVQAAAKKHPPAKQKEVPPESAEHSLTSVEIHTSGIPPETEDLTTMEGGGLAGRAASVAYSLLERTTTNNNSAMLQVIRNFVTKDFFPYVKFVTSNKKMAFYDANDHPDTYCSVITKGCHLPPNIEPANWWESVAKREVRKKIHQLRSDRITALKWDYFGTSS